MIGRVQYIHKKNEISKLYSFLRMRPLDYPGYLSWLERCMEEIESGYKKTVCAYDEKGAIVGSIIFQPHKKEEGVLEIKNIVTSEEYEKKGVGSLLVIFCEEFAKKEGFKRIVVDTHYNNKPVIQFFTRRGFKKEGEAPLYSPDVVEIIMSKVL